MFAKLTQIQRNNNETQGLAQKLEIEISASIEIGFTSNRLENLFEFRIFSGESSNKREFHAI